MNDLTNKVELIKSSFNFKNPDVINKFLATISLVPLNQLEDIINDYKKFGIEITDAKDIKILTISPSEFQKKCGILSEHAAIFRQYPSIIPNNTIEIFRRIQYCIQNSIPFIKDGKYETFLFTDEWTNIVNKKNDRIVSVDFRNPKEEKRDPYFNPIPVEEKKDPYNEPSNEMSEPNPMIDNDIDKSFDAGLDRLKRELADLDFENENADNVISFGDITSDNIGSLRR